MIFAFAMVVLLTTPSELFGSPEPGAAGPGVFRQFSRPGRHRLAGQDAQPGDPAAGAAREPLGAGASGCPAAEEMLDDPVLQGVKGDHHRPPPRPEPLEAGRETLLQTLQL